MKRSVEVSGKSLEEVLERASRYFDVPKEHLNYEVLSENKGFLGILVPRVVKVRVWVDEDEAVSVPAEQNEPARVSSATTSTRETSTVNLAELGESAVRFLENLFEKMQVDVKTTLQEENGTLYCEIDGKDAGVLIGKKGETLEAIEVLLRTFLSKNGFEGGNLELDVAGYKKRREESLRKLAEKMAQKVLKEKKRVKLEPMNARERRVIHTALKEHPQVTTYSVGTEPTRRVVIELKGAKGPKVSEGEKRPKSTSSRSANAEKGGRNTRRRPRKEGGPKKSLEE